MHQPVYLSGRFTTFPCAAQEHQASVSADVSTLQPQVADLVQQVISDSAAADVKAQRRADALSATCSIVEALQRLLPADGQAGLDGHAAALAEAAVQQQAALGSAPGKVGMSDTHSGVSLLAIRSCAGSL